MLHRMFSRRSHRAEIVDIVDGVEVGRPVVDSYLIPSRSFSGNSSGNSGKSNLSPDKQTQIRPGYHTAIKSYARRRQVRHRPPPLRLETLTINRQQHTNGTTNGDGDDGTRSTISNVLSPVRRSGAVRHPINPLMRRCQTFSGSAEGDPTISSAPAHQDAPRSAVSRSNAIRYQANPLSARLQSEPLAPSHASESSPETVRVDLSTPFVPLSRHRAASNVRRSEAVRRAENPLTAHAQNFPDNARRAPPHTATAGAGAGAFPSPAPVHNHPDDLPPDEIQALPSRLKVWINTGMTACDIGRYTAKLLDGRDKFLDGFVTILVNAQVPYTHIGRVVVKRLNICNDAGEPLHNKIPPGITDLNACRSRFRPISPQPPSQSQSHAQMRMTQNPNNLGNQPIACPVPRRPVRMPLFASHWKLEDFIQNDQHSDGETDSEIATPKSSFDDPILQPAPERRVWFDGGGPTDNFNNSSDDDTTNSEDLSSSEGFSYGRAPSRQLVGGSADTRRRGEPTVLMDWSGVRSRGPFC